MSHYFVWSRLPEFIVGLSLIFGVERYFSSSDYYKIIGSLGLMLMIFCSAKTFWLSIRAKKQGFLGESQSWALLLIWQGVIFAALLCYALYRNILGDESLPAEFVGKLFLALWLVFFIVGIFSGIGLETAHAVNGRGHHVDPKRLKRAGQGWALIGSALAIVVALNYVGSTKDRAYDLSYLKSTTPGEASVNIVKALGEDLQVDVFFPLDNEVYPYIREYFSNIAQGQVRVEINYLDKDFDPVKAEKMRVSRNGQIIISKGDKRERIDIGLTLKDARKKLKTLDELFQKATLKLVGKKRVAYFTKGHGEFSWFADSRDSLNSIRLVETYLRNQNYSVKSFGISEGSSKQVPDDASIVVIMGPSSSLMNEEVSALRQYVDQGGNLMILLDVAKSTVGMPEIQNDSKDPLLVWLDEIGITYRKELLGNEKNYVSATRSKSDRWFLFTNTFTSHTSVASLAKHDERVPMLIFQSGYFDVRAHSGSWRNFETVRSLQDTFNDKNQNFKFDDKLEVKKSYVVGVATVWDEKKQENGRNEQPDNHGKIVTFADATAFSDAVIGAGPPGNLLYLADSLKWLMGDEELSGGTTSEKDVKIQHSKKEDTVWFYSSIFGVPMLILLMGFIATRRKRGHI